MKAVQSSLGAIGTVYAFGMISTCCMVALYVCLTACREGAFSPPVLHSLMMLLAACLIAADIRLSFLPDSEDGGAFGSGAPTIASVGAGDFWSGAASVFLGLSSGRHGSALEAITNSLQH